MFDKEALRELRRPMKPESHIVEKDGYTFGVNLDGNVNQIMTEEVTTRDSLSLSTLDSLVDYIKSDLDFSGHLYLHIADYDKVQLKGTLLKDGERDLFAEVYAPVPKNTLIGKWSNSEEFLIGMNAQFFNVDDRNKLIAFAGNVKEENARQTSDDGFSQKTTVKRGIASAEEELVPNPVLLAPYRTFAEVDQPSSEFIFRMGEGPRFALFEADGGAWKLEAISTIKSYLETELKVQVEKGKVTILA